MFGQMHICSFIPRGKGKINVRPLKAKTLFNLQGRKILADLKVAELNLAEANRSANGFQS